MIWDRIIVLPLIINVTLAGACLIQVLASPRVFSKFHRRVTVSAALGLYIVLMLIELPRAAAGLWYIDAISVVRWLAQTAPAALSLWLMRKLETLRTDEPLRRALWAREIVKE